MWIRFPCLPTFASLRLPSCAASLFVSWLHCGLASSLRVRVTCGAGISSCWPAARSAGRFLLPSCVRHGAVCGDNSAFSPCYCILSSASLVASSGFCYLRQHNGHTTWRAFSPLRTRTRGALRLLPYPPHARARTLYYTNACGRHLLISTLAEPAVYRRFGALCGVLWCRTARDHHKRRIARRVNAGSIKINNADGRHLHCRVLLPP